MENFNFKKKFGQNFIKDTNLLKAIVRDSEISSEDNVLEIGAGAGTLTEELAKASKRLVSFEIDTDLQEHLCEKLNSYKNVKLVFKDIMKVNIEEIEQEFDGSYKLVANLPYYITTPIIFRFLEESKKLESMTIMVQKEVAEKLISNPKSNDYGVSSVMAQSYCDLKIARIVNKKLFFPVPKVDSAILVMKRKDFEYSKSFKEFVQAIFSMRRKTMINNLSSFYKLSKEDLNAFLTSQNIPLSSRAEEFSPSKIYELSIAFDKFRQNLVKPALF